ncbi:MAG: DegQ family serine endoprotease [Candidatus Latescibacteria bacterium]|nr:DegQ family serine endoprotease [Candidatus Latescibacterota bacterium]
MFKSKKLFAGISMIFILFLFVVWLYNNIVTDTQSSSQNLLGKHVQTFLTPQEAIAQKGVNVSISDVAEKSVKSVVNISSKKVIKSPYGGQNSPYFNDPFFKRFFGPNFRFDEPSEQRQQSLGSGVIVSKDGIILTNNHVIQDAEEIKVVLHDEREFEAEILGTDPESDLAVVKLKGDVKDLQPLTFGNSDVLRLGEYVLAIGNPFGLSHTVTMGIVSAKGRNHVGLVDYEDFIQTDAAINPGNSGGALINLQGELVGINTAIASQSGGYQGVGFAIPSNMAKTVMDNLIDHGKIVRGWLGVGIQEITQDIADAMNLSSRKGILVSDVFEDGPAEKAGLKSGDIITRVENEEIDSVDQLRNKIAFIGPDTKVTVTILRDGKEKDISVKLAERTDEVRQAALTRQKSENSDSLDGLTVSQLNDTIKNQFKIPEEIDYGVVILQVESGSKASQAGLMPGDVIREINNKTIDSIDLFRNEYKNSKKAVLLYVYRNGGHFFKGLSK